MSIVQLYQRTIAESELFGHVKGAFTGATADRAGKFEIANSGILFLDEIGELPLSIQAKMLRAIQEGEIQRVGSDENIMVDVRIVAATNRDLQQEVEKGRFRADLYHRLSVYPVSVPPLRERGKDILLLAGNMLERDQARLGVQGLRLAAEASNKLLAYHWPGNVRELGHLLSRASLKAVAEQGRDLRTVTIQSKHLDVDVALNSGSSGSNRGGDSFSMYKEHSVDVNSIVLLPVDVVDLKTALDEFQYRLIVDRLEKNKGNLAATARELSVNKSNFYRLLKRLDLHPGKSND